MVSLDEELALRIEIGLRGLNSAHPSPPQLMKEDGCHFLTSPSCSPGHPVCL